MFPPCSASTLTERETRICDLIATAAPNQEIASELGLSLLTVKKHITLIFDKTGMSSRTELAVRHLSERYEQEISLLRSRLAA